MQTYPVLKSVRRLLPDAIAGLTTFALIIGLAAGDTTVSAAHRGAAAFGDHQTGLLLVAAAASLVVAFNTAFIRHLVRAYAAPHLHAGPKDSSVFIQRSEPAPRSIGLDPS